eukprot:9269828-Pyramimonas_sp.AAC.1
MRARPQGGDLATRLDKVVRDAAARAEPSLPLQPPPVPATTLRIASTPPSSSRSAPQAIGWTLRATLWTLRAVWRMLRATGWMLRAIVWMLRANAAFRFTFLPELTIIAIAIVNRRAPWINPLRPYLFTLRP